MNPLYCRSVEVNVCGFVCVCVQIQVRNADASWRETRKRLHRDHRWSLAKSLDKTEKERLFEEHVAMLNRKNKELFHRLLDDTPGITLTSTWKEVRKLIRSDPRCARFSSHDRVNCRRHKLKIQTLSLFFLCTGNSILISFLVVGLDSRRHVVVFFKNSLQAIKFDFLMYLLPIV